MFALVLSREEGLSITLAVLQLESLGVNRRCGEMRVVSYISVDPAGLAAPRACPKSPPSTTRLVDLKPLTC